MPRRDPLMYPRNAYHFWVMDNKELITASKQGSEGFSTTAGRLWNVVEDRSKWQRQAERDKRRFLEPINAAADVQPDEEIGADQNMDEVVHLDEEFFDEQLSDAEEQFSEDDDEQQDEGFAGDHLLDGDWHPDEIFEIERIVDHRFTNTERLQYLTKWVGYPDDQNTWEPEETFNDYPELINQYGFEYNQIPYEHPYHYNDGGHPYHDDNGQPFHDMNELIDGDEHNPHIDALNDHQFGFVDNGHFGEDNVVPLAAQYPYDDMMDEFQFGLAGNVQPDEAVDLPDIVQV